MASPVVPSTGSGAASGGAAIAGGSGLASNGSSGSPVASGSGALGTSGSFAGASGALTSGESSGEATLDASVGDAADDARTQAVVDSGPPLSCVPGGPGMTDCGPSKENCCTSLLVSGGTFYRTYGSDADGGPTLVAYPATISSFRLDKYDVTVGRFRQFVNAVLPPDGGTGWLPAIGSGKHAYLNGGMGLANPGGGYEPGWTESDDSVFVAPEVPDGDIDDERFSRFTLDNLSSYCPGTWTAQPAGNENLPMDCVTWWDAYAFCIWDGGAFLPSSAEWEYAAAGGSEQREYPWGSTDPGAANGYAIYNCYYPGDGGCDLAPVGTASLGAGRWGQLDLAGNAYQWNLDWYQRPPYAACTDCADTAGTFTSCAQGIACSNNVIGGGNYASGASTLFAAGQSFGVMQGGIGFRCARSPGETTVAAGVDDAGSDAGSKDVTGDSGQPPSCAPGGLGMTNCGLDEESCCTSPLVTGGTFYRSYDTYEDGGVSVVDVEPDGGPTDEAFPATISSFRLDKYDVTVGRFRQFANAVSPPGGGAGWLPAPGSGIHAYLNDGLGLVNVGGGSSYEQGWIASYDSLVSVVFTGGCGASEPTDPANTSTWTTMPGSNENLPINCVNWWTAYAFCIWDGAFLPSQAEWECAAAGGDEQREYPWGSTDPGTANQYAIYGTGNIYLTGNISLTGAVGCYYPTGPLVSLCTGATNIAPVGTATFGAGRWDQLDLVGNMSQWVLDEAGGAWVVPCTDCANATPASYLPFLGGTELMALPRIVQGGGFDGPASTLVSTYGSGSEPGFGGANLGFRCARAP